MSDRNAFQPDSIAALAAVARLLAIAKTNSGQARRVADFLLAWHNAEENGGWDPVDLWQLDSGIAQDILLVTTFIAVERKYPDDLGFAPEIAEVWNLWRGNRITEREPSADERAGMDWWNLLPESGRAAWLAKAQSAKPSDAWATYKRTKNALEGYGQPSPEF